MTDLYASKYPTPKAASYTIEIDNKGMSFRTVNRIHDASHVLRVVRNLKQMGLTVRITEHVVYQTSDNQKRVEDKDIHIKKLEAIVTGNWIREPKKFRVLTSNDVAL